MGPRAATLALIDGLKPVVHVDAIREWERRVHVWDGRWTQLVHGSAEREQQRLGETRARCEATLERISDDLNTLMREGRAGRLDAAVFAKTFGALTQEHADCERRLDDGFEAVDGIDERLADPIAYVDSLYELYPALARPVF